MRCIAGILMVVSLLLVRGAQVVFPSVLDDGAVTICLWDTRILEPVAVAVVILRLLRQMW